MSTKRSQIRNLSKDDPIIRMCMDMHDYRGIGYDDAIEYMVIALAESNKYLRELLLKSWHNSPNPIKLD